MFCVKLGGFFVLLHMSFTSLQTKGGTQRESRDRLTAWDKTKPTLFLFHFCWDNGFAHTVSLDPGAVQMLQSCRRGHAQLIHQCMHGNTYLPNTHISYCDFIVSNKADNKVKWILYSKWYVYVAKVICSGFTNSRSDVGQMFSCCCDSSSAVTYQYYANRSNGRYHFCHSFYCRQIIMFCSLIAIYLNLFVAEPQDGKRHLPSDTVISGKNRMAYLKKNKNLSWLVPWPLYLHVVYFKIWNDR